MKCRTPRCENKAVKNQAFCADCQDAISRNYHDPGLHLQPVSKWQPQTTHPRKRGTDYRGFDK